MLLVHVFLEQRVLPTLNSRSLPILHLERPEIITFFPTAAESAAGCIDIVLDLPDAKSPFSLGISNDVRILGIGLNQIIVEAILDGQ